MKIRTDFVTNSSSSSFVTFELHDSEFCRFVWNKMQELNIPYVDKTNYLSEFDFNENSLSGEICTQTLYEEGILYAELSYWVEEGEEVEVYEDFIEDYVSDLCIDFDIFSIKDHLSEKSKLDFYQMMLDSVDSCFTEDWKNIADEDERLDWLENEFDEYFFDTREINYDSDGIQVTLPDKVFCESLFHFLKTVQLDDTFSFSGDCCYFRTNGKTLEIHKDYIECNVHTNMAKFRKDFDDDEYEIKKIFLDIMHYFLPLSEIAEDAELQKLLDHDNKRYNLEIGFHMGCTD